MSNGSSAVNYEPGDIVIIALYDNTPVANKVVSAANSVWASLPPELDKYANAPFSIGQSNQQYYPMLQKLKVKKLPALVFTEYLGNGQWKTLTTLTGDVPSEVIENTYYRTINDIYGRGDNALAQKISEFGLIPGPGAGMFSLPPEFVRGAMWFLALYSTYKAADANTPFSRGVFGAGAAYSYYQLFRKGKSTVHYE